MKRTHIILTLLVGLMAFTSCGAQKAAVKDTVTLPSAAKATPKVAKADHLQQLAFVQRVSDQKVVFVRSVRRRAEVIYRIWTGRL